MENVLVAADVVGGGGAVADVGGGGDFVARGVGLVRIERGTGAVVAAAVGAVVLVVSRPPKKTKNCKSPSSREDQVAMHSFLYLEMPTLTPRLLQTQSA